MALMYWKDTMSVNVSEIDEQHKKLVALLNQLHDAMRFRKANEVLGGIIAELLEYTKTHFAVEEKYFDEFGYTQADSHKREHKGFIEKIIQYKQQFESGQLMISMEVLKFLKDWLTKHIEGSDKAYSSLFRENGLS